MEYAKDNDERTHEIRDDADLAVSIAFDVACNVERSELGDDILTHPIKQGFQPFLVMPVGKLPVRRVGDDDTVVGGVRVDLAEGSEETWPCTEGQKKTASAKGKKSFGDSLGQF